MKVLVVGANGQIGQHIVKKLSESEKYEVRAMLRNQEQASTFEEIGVESVITDLEGEVEEIVKAGQGCQVIIFTAGSGGHTGADKTILIDLDGAIKTIEAAEELGVQRFIMVSAINADKRDDWSIPHYHAAKYYADKRLEASSLNYTIVRPGGLTNEPGLGSIAAAESLVEGQVPREDVATTVVEAIDEVNTYKRGFDLLTGNTPIQEALKAL